MICDSEREKYKVLSITGEDPPDRLDYSRSPGAVSSSLATAIQTATNRELCSKSRSEPEVSVTTVDENGGVKPLDVAVDRMKDKWSVLSPAANITARIPLVLEYRI